VTAGLLLAAGLVAAYLLGAVPSAQILARRLAGIDLTELGTGTASPSNLYRSAGRWPALAAGAVDVAKGVLAVLLVGGHGRGWFAALAGTLAVTGHNWSPFLRWRGGRGLSTATGALFVVCWPGAVVMCAGLAIGVAARRVIPVMGLALFALVPVVALTAGWVAAVMAAAVVAPIGAKTALLRLRSARASPPPAGARTGPEST
jgi:glycerol-3-phosphate acyltransferase PlsY